MVPPFLCIAVHFFHCHPKAFLQQEHTMFFQKWHKGKSQPTAELTNAERVKVVRVRMTDIQFKNQLYYSGQYLSVSVEG